VLLLSVQSASALLQVDHDVLMNARYPGSAAAAEELSRAQSGGHADVLGLRA
jgi:hypothetical protein